MVTAYEIITIAQFEAYKSVDYSDLQDAGDPDAYTDTIVEAWISQAERIVVAYTKQTYDASSAPAAVIAVVMDLAGIIADNQLVKDELIKEQTIRPFLDSDMMFMLDTLLDEEKSEGAVYEVVSVEDYV